MSTPTNTRFSVAAHVLTYLAGNPGRAVSSDELAASSQVSPVHIRKVLGPLRTAGLIESRPGARGGSLLGRPATSIRLDEVWSLLQGDDPVLGHHMPSPRCPVGREISAELHDLDDEIRAALVARLRRTTVADLLTPAMERAFA
ncbi:MAG: Rrf2 family transcriptional regulator [Actinomycetia bacterium]|nr:Rrf2 family transcriptional regulator [Actinomycetes bacterium]